MDSPLDLSYIAGFFDGEGSVTIQKVIDKRRQTPHYSLNIMAQNTNEEVIRDIHAFFKVGCVQVYESKKGYKTQWRWRVASQEARKVLEMLIPYLHVKREQAELAIYFQTHLMGKIGWKPTDDQVKARQDVKVKMTELNARFGRVKSLAI